MFSFIYIGILKLVVYIFKRRA